jgi:hypothetical protein
MEKDPRCYVECNVDGGEREMCRNTPTWHNMKERQTDRQTKGWQENKYKKCTYNKAKLTQK